MTIEYKAWQKGLIHIQSLTAVWQASVEARWVRIDDGAWHPYMPPNFARPR